MDLTVKDAAKFLEVDETTIQTWIDEKNLPACKVRGKRLLNREDLLEWATVNRIKVSPALLRKKNTETMEYPGIAETLERGGVFYDIQGNDKPQILRLVVDRLRLPQAVDRNFLLQVLLAREALGSTGIGNGIAIPHPRTPLVLNVDAPIVSLTLLEKPVDFGALDGEPVHAVFTLICPSVKAHLHLLSRLAYMLHDSAFCEKLKSRAQEPEIIAEALRLENAIGHTADKKE